MRRPSNFANFHPHLHILATDGGFGPNGREWLGNVGVKTLFIEPGSPWENGYVESFNGKMRDELLNREVFTTLLEAKVLVERWRREYNQVRPHSSLNYLPPAPEAIMPPEQEPLALGVVQ